MNVENILTLFLYKYDTAAPLLATYSEARFREGKLATFTGGNLSVDLVVVVN